MNFEELLKKYMQHVLECEGATFVKQPFKKSKFTEEERDYLIKLDDALYEEEVAEYERWKTKTNIP